jgi:hypothetical protein
LTAKLRLRNNASRYLTAKVRLRNNASRFGELNERQQIAFNIFWKHFETAQEVGLDELPHLLLNVSGGAGTGKNF